MFSIRICFWVIWLVLLFLRFQPWCRQMVCQFVISIISAQIPLLYMWIRELKGPLAHYYCGSVHLCVCVLLRWYTAHHCYGNAPQGGSVCSVWLMRQLPTSPCITSSWGRMAAEKAALLRSAFSSTAFLAVLSFCLLLSQGFFWHHLVTTFLSHSLLLFLSLHCFSFFFYPHWKKEHVGFT